MPLRVDPFKGTLSNMLSTDIKRLRLDKVITHCIPLVHILDIKFLQVVFPVCIHHLTEYCVYLLIIALPALFQELYNFILRDSCTDGPEVST